MLLHRRTKVVLQFLLNSAIFIPTSAKNIETGERRNCKKDDHEYTIGPVEMCSLEDFPDELQRLGFKLLNPTWQLRYNKNDEPYYAARFTFVKNPSVVETMAAWNDLQKMVCEALWRVWGYRGSQVINLGSRIPITSCAKPSRYLYVLNNNIGVVDV